MFDKTSELAEWLATSISRRRFLGSMGRWSAAAALGVATVLTGATTARGGNHSTCCYYAACSSCIRPPLTCRNGATYCDIIVVGPGVSCPATYFGCPLSFSAPNGGQGCKC
jgi:hypothetical protein